MENWSFATFRIRDKLNTIQIIKDRIRYVVLVYWPPDLVGCMGLCLSNNINPLHSKGKFSCHVNQSPKYVYNGSQWFLNILPNQEEFKNHLLSVQTCKLTGLSQLASSSRSMSFFKYLYIFIEKSNKHGCTVELHRSTIMAVVQLTNSTL